MGVFTKKRVRSEAEESRDGLLSALFDFQEFAGNPQLAALMQETEARLGAVLSDEDIAEVSAAGDVSYKKPPKRFEE